MAFKKRRMMLIPDVNPKSFVFFFEKGNSGTSWSIRDYSVRNRVKEYGPRNFHWTADEIHERAVHSIDAPTVSTDNLAYWHDFTLKCNEQYLQSLASQTPTQAPSVPTPPAQPETVGALPSSVPLSSAPLLPIKPEPSLAVSVRGNHLLQK
jgi:hypothetical protein